MLEDDLPLKPWERLCTGMDIGSPDGDAIMWIIYDERTGRARIIDAEYIPVDSRKRL